MNGLTYKLGRLLGQLSPSPKAPALGERELEVMKIVWQGEQLSAKEVLCRSTDSELSLSTMQSTLERLYRKNLLYREKTGRFFVYRAAVSRSQIISQLLGDITEQICDGDVTPLLSGFSDFCSEKSQGTATTEHDQVTPASPESPDDSVSA
ncbi:BlaI/MecI/CopY family transcriptional regulator [Planctobacterium marinum]|uniref:BlaI/MecI/CopY family transcriptional regulator n=1 Tax=Planctobacterium marinum TaxID=1631968 RepID=UPI001E64A3DE|nr:BlaI/MecI/CopY family transcriptional regulator [Planctobacterium marinum]MCC2605232.1 BlaI/MecI/CopY family transcriptional regulator [Planctobacterium marinum]